MTDDSNRALAGSVKPDSKTDAGGVAAWSRANLVNLMSAVSKSHMDLNEQEVFGKIAEAMIKHLTPPAPVRCDGEPVARATIEKALCCPKGCVRNDDCYAASKRWMNSSREREQADAIMAIIIAAPPARSDAILAAANRASAKCPATAPSDRWLEAFLAELPAERCDAGSVEALEHIAEIIREEVRTTSSGIIHNSTDVAKMILKRVLTSPPPSGVREALKELTGAMRFVLAFYEPGQRYLDTEAWKIAEAGARAAFKKAETALSQLPATDEAGRQPTWDDVVEKFGWSMTAPPKAPDPMREALEAFVAICPADKQPETYHSKFHEDLWAAARKAHAAIQAGQSTGALSDLTATTRVRSHD